MNQGAALVALSAILYGCIGYFGVHLMQAGFSVCDLLLWRFLMSAGMLLPMLGLFFKACVHVSIKDVIRLFSISALFYGGGTACYFEAAKSIGTGLAMVIFFTYPLVVALLSVWLKKHSLSALTSLSLLLIVVGCFMIAFGEGLAFEIDLQGISTALVAGVSYGLYIFFTKESCKHMPPLLSAWIVCFANALLFFAYAYVQQKHFLLPADIGIWRDIALFALIGTVLPIFLLLQGMKSLSASKASIIGVLEPVSTLAVGALVLQEEVAFWQYLGAFIILLSAILVQLEKDLHSVGIEQVS